MSIFNNIIGEENIIKESSKMMDVAKLMNDEAKVIFKNESGSHQKIKEYEELGDTYVLSLLESITSGSISPNLLDDFVKYIDKEDDILDFTSNLVQEFLMYKPIEPEAQQLILKSLNNFSELNEKAIYLLKNMQSTDNRKNLKELHAEIKKVEREGDNIKDRMFKSAYDLNLSYKTFYHIIQLAHYADDILDSFEDASDLLITIVFSLLS